MVIQPVIARQEKETKQGYAGRRNSLVNSTWTYQQKSAPYITGLATQESRPRVVRGFKTSAVCDQTRIDPTTIRRQPISTVLNSYIRIVNSMDMHPNLAQLSSRQKEILELIASDQPVDIIVRRLSLTIHTIRAHQQLMIRLFELDDETALIQLAKSIYL